MLCLHFDDNYYFTMIVVTFNYIPFEHRGIFNRLGLALILLLISKYFYNDLMIKFPEMYSKINLKNLIYSLIGIFISKNLFTEIKNCKFRVSNAFKS